MSQYRRNTLPLGVALLLLCLTPAAADAARRAQPSQYVRASVPTCQTSLVQAQRTVEFSGEMQNVRAADRLQIRFVLEGTDAATGSAQRRWARVKAPGFGVWNTSDTRVKRYQYTKRVENLLAPARYRVQVSFRWLDADGRITRRETATSPVCRQPDLRPNLVAGDIVQTPGGYSVPVRNAGPTASAPFEVTLDVNGVAKPVAAVPSLAVKEQQLVAIAGPPCEAGTEIVVTVDSGNVIAERDEGDNMVSLSCS